MEFALREAARRARQHRIWSEGLGLTPEQLAADAAPKPSDRLDAPDIDEEAVDRAGEVIPLPDLIIGATALGHRAAVLTFDRHFRKIPGVVAVSDLE